jgi:hypothetical protein
MAITIPMTTAGDESNSFSVKFKDGQSKTLPDLAIF